MTQLNEIPLAQLRAQLAEARIQLRADRDCFQIARDQAEQRMLDGAGGPKALGANEEERSRKLRLATAENEATAHWLDRVRKGEADVDRLEADLASRLDQRRAQEWDVRTKLADLLETQLGLQPQLDDAATDNATSALARLAL